MRAYQVAYAPQAEAHLISLYRYIAARGSPVSAKRFTDAIVVRCEDLAEMPLQGALRDDLRPGLRTLSFRRRVVIAYAIAVRAKRVTILGVFYGGQDYEALLREDD